MATVSLRVFHTSPNPNQTGDAAPIVGNTYILNRAIYPFSSVLEDYISIWSKKIWEWFCL